MSTTTRRTGGSAAASSASPSPSPSGRDAGAGRCALPERLDAAADEHEDLVDHRHRILGKPGVLVEDALELLERRGGRGDDHADTQGVLGLAEVGGHAARQLSLE